MAVKVKCEGSGSERESSSSAYYWAGREYTCPTCGALLLGKTRRRRILGEYEYYIRVARHERRVEESR